jgi:EAL domain-containing protein (putative c-di-GMP-specific phosphodiesterase class I)
MECDIIQGYYIGRPVALAEFRKNFITVEKPRTRARNAA